MTSSAVEKPSHYAHHHSSSRACASNGLRPQFIGSKSGLQAIQTVTWMDIILALMNGSGAKALAHFQPPELKDIGGGRYLQQIVTNIAPIFWDALVHAFNEGKLQEPATLYFG